MKTICKNKKAFFDYQIHEKYQAGIVLNGDEVKSLRTGGASLCDSYALVREGEIFLINFYIPEYKAAFLKSKTDQTRAKRKLLMSKSQISKLAGLVSRKGYTLVPLQAYFNEKGLVKIDIACATHKKKINKKQEKKEKDLDRQTSRELKDRR